MIPARMLYIHIPFCSAKCGYCDFYSRPPSARFSADRYVDALLKELDMRIDEIGKLSTIYVGGGTPSVLPDRILGRLVETVMSKTDSSHLDEFTIEMNPENVSPERIAFYKSLGINRISIGIQSFNDELLTLIGRRNDATTARNALNTLSRANIDFSADLIYGLPRQTSRMWANSLAELLSYNPNHFSAYLLSYEPGTRLSAMLRQGKIEECPDDEIVEQYEILCNEARSNGYIHYEISNFCQPGKKAIHNSGYWQNQPYIGLGASAYSFNGEMRSNNPSDLKKYLESIEQSVLPLETEPESETDRYNDMIVTCLRTKEGIDQTILSEKWRENLTEASAPLLRQGKLREKDNKLFIAERNWLMADDIMRQLIEV